MKKVLLILSASISVLTAASQTLNWSTEVTVANGNTYGSTRPRVAATANNVPLVVWGSTSSDRLNYARGNGSGFGMVMSLTPNNVDPAVMSWQGHDMASDGNTVYVVFKSEPEMSGNIYIKKSTDGGVTWTDTVRVNMMGPYCRFPSIAVTDAGNPAVMFMTFDTTWMSATYVVANSNDGGQTFPMSPANVSGSGNSDVCDCCPAYMTTNGNTQAAAWRRNNNNLRDIWAGVSVDGGATFPTGIDMDNTNWMINACPSSGPVPYISGDSLYTVFMSGASGDSRLYISSYNIQTQQSGFIAQLATNISSNADQNYPFIAGNGDTMMVVWQQNDNGDVNTYYTWSATGAAGMINNAALLNTSAAGMQSNPHVAYADGMFHVVYTDMVTGNIIYKSATIIPDGIADAGNDQTLPAFPNPSDQEVRIDLRVVNGSNADFHLYDLSGRIIHSSRTNGNNILVVPRQNAGIYIAELRDEDSGIVYVTRLVFSE